MDTNDNPKPPIIENSQEKMISIENELHTIFGELGRKRQESGNYAEQARQVELLKKKANWQKRALQGDHAIAKMKAEVKQELDKRSRRVSAIRRKLTTTVMTQEEYVKLRANIEALSLERKQIKEAHEKKRQAMVPVDDTRQKKIKKWEAEEKKHHDHYLECLEDKKNTDRTIDKLRISGARLEGQKAKLSEKFRDKQGGFRRFNKIDLTGTKHLNDRSSTLDNFENTGQYYDTNMPDSKKGNRSRNVRPRGRINTERGIRGRGGRGRGTGRNQDSRTRGRDASIVSSSSSSSSSSFASSSSSLKGGKLRRRRPAQRKQPNKVKKSSTKSEHDAGVKLDDSKNQTSSKNQGAELTQHGKGAGIQPGQENHQETSNSVEHDMSKRSKQPHGTKRSQKKGNTLRSKKVDKGTTNATATVSSQKWQVKQAKESNEPMKTSGNGTQSDSQQYNPAKPDYSD